MKSQQLPSERIPYRSSFDCNLYRELEKDSPVAGGNFLERKTYMNKGPDRILKP